MAILNYISRCDIINYQIIQAQGGEYCEFTLS